MTGTTQQLKQQINEGRSGDKVPMGLDPGLATLGTDDEAAGTPNTAEQVQLAQCLEQGGATGAPPEQAASGSTHPFLTVWPILVVFALIVAVALTAWLGRT